MTDTQYRRVHETTTPDAAEMGDAYDDHHYDPSSQDSVNTITGTTEMEPSREGEVMQMLVERYGMQEAVKQMSLILNLSGKHVQRVIQGSSQIRTSTIFAPGANTPVQICGKNLERSRLLLSPIATLAAANGFVVISADPNVGATNFNPTIGAFPNNAAVFRCVGTAVAGTIVPLIELRTVENLWMTTDLANGCMIGIVEEWVS